MAPSINRLWLFLVLTLGGIDTDALCSEVGKEKPKEKGAISRIAEIHQVEHIDGHRLRMIFSAQERDGIHRFPITTIDRSMVKVEFTNTSTPPAEAKSLLLHGSGGSELKRALYIGFSLHRKLNLRAIEEVRYQVGELLKELPAEFLTAAAISQDSARVITDATPGNGDNINRIRQQLQALEPEGEGPALADTLCVAAERFHAWDLSKFKKGDQKVLVILSSPGDSPSTERYRGENCWRSLLDQGVRVFNISFGSEIGRSTFDLASVAQDSGGYVHRVNGPVEMFAATKNVMALLNNEYVIDLDAPDIALEDQPLDLRLKLSYHDEMFESKVYNVGFVIPDLSKVFTNAMVSTKNASNEAGGQQGEESSFKVYSILILFVILAVFGAVSFGAFKYFKFRMRTKFCNTCALNVEKDHSNCPFRKAECVARLVVIGGAHAGQTIPIMKGETLIARFPSSGAKVQGRKISWWHHGTIRLDGQKALYTPSKIGRDRINGWLVHEPRLLGVGSVLSIGDQKLRFEVKPQNFG
jgi:hypothetical protein